MKKEGTGEPRNPDIALDAGVKMRELRFDKVPDPEVCFGGNTRRDSVWQGRRKNLPDEVSEGVVYRDAGVRLRIASEIVGSDPDYQNTSDSERVKTDLEPWERKTREQVTQSREETE
jgi:hypothetical protein